MADIILNLFIFGVTAYLVVRCFISEVGKWDPQQGKKAFRFFTCLSNIFCAAAALLTAMAGMAGPVPGWIWTLKYMGTAAVTVTMMTVFLFLGPSIGKGWAEVLLKGSRNLFMHLITPLMAIFSFCILEKRGMSFAQSLWGLLPVLLYGALYLYRILFAPEGKRWDDFYGFNKGGKWPVTFTAMLIGTFLICVGLMALQNL